MPEISLTDFTGFTLRVGISKLRKVQEIQNRDDYTPAFDFWKPLRDAIRNFHKNGTPLDGVLTNLKDPKKLHRYPQALKAYKKWTRNKQIDWFNPPSSSWEAEGLTVRVHPELGLRIDGAQFVVKLHFKDEALTQGRLVVPLQLMRNALQTSARVALMDVGKSRLFPLNAGVLDATPLLLGEAAAFLAMWNELSKET